MLTVQSSNVQEGGEGGKGSAGDSPPAEKYPRLNNNSPPPASPSSVTPPGARDPPAPTPPSGETQGDGEAKTSVAVSRARGKKPTRGSSPTMTQEVLHRDVLPMDNDQEASSESQEGSNSGDGIVEQEAVGDPAGCGGMEWDDEEMFSSSFSFSFASSPPSCFPPGGVAAAASRRQRKFTPDNRKDEVYWERRRKNNEAARKSREKRRLHDMMLENRIVDLEEDNGRMRVELQRLKTRYGIPLDATPVLLGPQERGAERMRDDASPPTLPVAVSLCGHSGEGGVLVGVGPPALTPMVSRDPNPSSSSSPPPQPPLLAMPTRVLPSELQQMGLAGMFSAQASSLPAAFFMSAMPAVELPLAHLTASTHPVTHPVIPPAHQHDRTMLMVKRESEEDDVSGLPLQCSLLKQNYRELDRMPRGECREMYPLRYAAGSPQGLSTPATLPAHCGWSDAVPTARYQLDQFATTAPLHYSWQRSPLSSHSSDDMSDEPLQLTVHRRGSKTESVDEDSGSEGAVSVSKDKNFSINSCVSSHSSLPLKLRHKIPLNLSPPHQTNPEGLSSTGGPSLASGLTHFPSDLTSIQDAPLSLIKKEPTGAISLDTTPRQGINGCMRTDQDHQTDPKHLDAKYLERRQRNNEAARKCRENRRNMTKLWEAKSDHLQSENSQLRQEMDSLQEEMRQLRELLDKKQAGQDPQGLPQESSSSSPSPHQFALQSQKRTAQRLQQLQEEHRLLKREQRPQEKRSREKRQQQHQQQREVRKDLRNVDDLDDHGDVN